MLGDGTGKSFVDLKKTNFLEELTVLDQAADNRQLMQDEKNRKKES